MYSLCFRLFFNGHLVNIEKSKCRVDRFVANVSADFIHFLVSVSQVHEAIGRHVVNIQMCGSPTATCSARVD